MLEETNFVYLFSQLSKKCFGALQVSPPAPEVRKSKLQERRASTGQQFSFHPRTKDAPAERIRDGKENIRMRGQPQGGEDSMGMGRTILGQGRPEFCEE